MIGASLTVQELLKLRERIDSQLTECLERLNSDPTRQEGTSVSSVSTPIGQDGTKKRKLESDPEHSSSNQASFQELINPVPNEIPCRVDLSSFAYLFHDGFVKQMNEVESKAGKKSRPSYIYGNYPNYYSYRLNEDSLDPRLQTFEKEWFYNKKCLDLGSHIGVFPLSLVLEFAPYSMIGIEIDPLLVQQAQRSSNQLKSSFKTNKQILRNLKNTQFLNYDVLDFMKQQPEECFDVITCLSVSKWIHFHHGDEGMCEVFQQFWRILSLNGRLIFEPQSMKSYVQAVRKQDMSAIPYLPSKIQFLPDQFVEYLTETIGFTLQLEITSKESGKGFDRPIYVLTKRDVKL